MKRHENIEKNSQYDCYLYGSQYATQFMLIIR